jgi:nanoRNase/pAp phosphatase (c-di-AMP/oligoRNAs hydrolase)
VKFSFRSCDPDKYDVSMLAASLGGGGHKGAAGLGLFMPLEEAKKKVVDAIGEMFPELR